MDDSYVPLILHVADERDVSDRLKKMFVTFEVAKETEQFYGVDFVAAEYGESDASASEKVELFVDGMVDNAEGYQEDYERLYEKHQDTVDELFDKYD
jgi:hypothetical protein